MELNHEIPDWVFDACEDIGSEVHFITGGLGSGKTYGSAFWHVERCFRNKESKTSWHLAPTHSKCETISVPAFTEVLYDKFNLVEGTDYLITGKNPRLLQFKNHVHPKEHKVIFHSANKPRLLVGENISHWSATEVGYNESRDWFDRCQFRTRDRKAEVLQGLAEGTPEGFNYYQELADFDGYDPVNNFRRFTVETDDNPHLPDGYVAKLVRTLAHDPGKLISYRKGLFVPFTKGTAYWNFFASRNIESELEPSPFLPLMLCFDFNHSPLAWVVMQHQPHKKGQLRYKRFAALEESSGTSRGLLDACAEFIHRFDPAIWGKNPVEVYGDPSGFFNSHKSPSCDFDQIHQHLKSRYPNLSIRADRAAPRIRARLDRVNTLMAYDQYVVSTKCANLIKSHTTTSLKPGTWEIAKPPGEDWTHYSDATGYPLFQLTKAMDLENPNAEKITGFNA